MRTLRVALAVVVLAAVAVVIGCHKSKPSITVCMYSEYIDPELLKEFEAKTGTKVLLEVYETTEDMMAKLKAGHAYDVLVVSDHAIPGLVALKHIQPLDLRQVPNAKHVAEKFKDPPYDRGQKYSLPYQWGTMGIMYRKDKVPTLEPTWSVILDPAKQPGPVVLIESMRDMLAAALLWQGKSVNSTVKAEVDAAAEAVRAAKAGKVISFEGGMGGVRKVLAGDAVAAIVYNGDAVREADEHAAFVIPKEGTIIWVDAMTVPAKARNVSAAHAFINFILDPAAGAKLSNFNRYPTPNAASLPLIAEEDRNNPAIYPPDDEVKRMVFLEDLGDATRLYDDAWTRIKAR